jgi:hypothetical protein
MDGTLPQPAEFVISSNACIGPLVEGTKGSGNFYLPSTVAATIYL